MKQLNSGRWVASIVEAPATGGVAFIGKAHLLVDGEPVDGRYRHAVCGVVVMAHLAPLGMPQCRACLKMARHG